jgi:hypothetical protein
MAQAIPAVISGIGSIFSGITGKNGAKKAAQIQSAAMDKAMAQQQAQFDQTRADFSPFLTGGTSALNGSGGVMDLVGLHGNDPQAAAIEQLKKSPAFTSLYDTGQDTILQNAAATGGLRGGNTQMGLAKFGSNLLATVIQNQLSNLGGLVNIGAGTAGQLGSLGQANSSAISNLLSQQGNANASGVLGSAWAQQNMINGLTDAFQSGGKSMKWW